MNDRKLRQLFDTVRREPPLEPSPGFESRVLSGLRREPPVVPASLFDQLSLLFPRLAWAAVLVVALCVAADYSLDAFGMPDISAGTAQLSDQWLFTENGF